MRHIHIGERIILTLWVGGLWAIGFLAVPVLFHTLNDRNLAGQLAAPMFRFMNGIGLACGGILFFGAALRQGRIWYRSWRVRVIVLMMAGSAVILFVIQPQIVALKAQLTANGELGPQFGRLHGISSAIYLLVSVLGLFLVGAGGQHRSEP